MIVVTSASKSRKFHNLGNSVLAHQIELPKESRAIMDHSCNSCVATGLASIDELKAHYRTDWHRYNLKRKIAGLKPVTKLNFEQRKGE